MVKQNQFCIVAPVVVWSFINKYYIAFSFDWPVKGYLTLTGVVCYIYFSRDTRVAYPAIPGVRYICQRGCNLSLNWWCNYDFCSYQQADGEYQEDQKIYFFSCVVHPFAFLPLEGVLPQFAFQSPVGHTRDLVIPCELPYESCHLPHRGNEGLCRVGDAGL